MGPLVAHRTVLLVTHHVELVLPGMHYLIQMLNGRIHLQGTVHELRQRGLLDHIAHDTYLPSQGKNEDGLVTTKEAVDNQSLTRQGNVEANCKPKQARKLVEDEVRAQGMVRWSIYKTYLKAS